MKVGIIGIGDICKKAYLPLITLKDDIEIILCTRNLNTISEVKNKYRISEAVNSIDELISQNIDCAFVHSSTESHFEISKKLLNNGINVYVDKPLSYSLEEAIELADLAKKNKKILKVGFNRRYAPMVSSLKDLGNPDIVIIEKNRIDLPGEPRVFIYDDFIHVVDTLRFLMGDDYDKIDINYKMKDNKLVNVVLSLSNSKTTAIGMMNRDNGITEEIIEYMASGRKAIVKNLSQTTSFESNTTSLKDFGDWENTLHKRGFNLVIDSFLEDVKNNNLNYEQLDDFIKTHKLCEKILKNIK